MDSDIHKWLEREDKAARPGRQVRLRWIVSHYPDGDGFFIGGGWLTHRLLEEAKYSFVYGQYVAAATLGAALVERILAAEFYAAGRDDLERAGIRDLLREALHCGWLAQSDVVLFDRIRRLRNPLMHFRAPLARDTIEFRSVSGNSAPEQIVEGDARDVLECVFRMLQRAAF